jgi:hypothetical protein
MKKFVFIAIVALLLISPMHLKAQESIISSGLTTSDRLIGTGNCLIYGVEIISGASTAVLSLYDSLTISGTTVFKGSCTITDAWRGTNLCHPIEVFTGIYADVTGTGAAYTVYYKCK